MGVIDNVEDQQGIRIHALGSFKLIIEDWMLENIKEQKEDAKPLIEIV